MGEPSNHHNTMMLKDEAYFDKSYYEGNGQTGDRAALKMYAKIANGIIKKKNAKVLDFGAGEGFLSKHLSNYFETYAFDISSYSSQVIPRNSPTTKVFTKLEDIPSGSMDGVITLHTLEHVPEPSQTLKELNRVLRTGGVLIFVVPNVDGLGHKIKKEKWFGFRDETHISMLKTTEWKNLLVKNGFTIKKVVSDGFWDPPYLPYLPLTLQKLIFLPTSGVMFLTNRLLLPETFGEDLVFHATKS